MTTDSTAEDPFFVRVPDDGPRAPNEFGKKIESDQDVRDDLDEVRRAVGEEIERGIKETAGRIRCPPNLKHTLEDVESDIRLEVYGKYLRNLIPRAGIRPWIGRVLPLRAQGAFGKARSRFNEDSDEQSIPDKSTMNNSSAEDAREILDQIEPHLSTGQRSVFGLRRKGYSTADIVEKLQVPPTTVEKRSSRIKTKARLRFPEYIKPKAG